MQKAFISYNHRDKAFAQRLVADLKARGISLFFDEMDLSVGDSLIDRIQTGIEEAAYVIAILSPASIESNWVKKELSAALTLEIKDQSVVVLPVVAEKCSIPLFLADKVYADFRASYETGLASLLKRLSASEPLRDVVFVPAGPFLYSKSKVARDVIKGFYMDVYPVTIADFARFVDDTGFAHAAIAPSGHLSGTASLLPVVNICVADAEAYCAWRSRIEKKRVRLPSALEWEKAARGTDGREYPWGDDGEYGLVSCPRSSLTVFRAIRAVPNVYSRGGTIHGGWETHGRANQFVAERATPS